MSNTKNADDKGDHDGEDREHGNGNGGGDGWSVLLEANESVNEVQFGTFFPFTKKVVAVENANNKKTAKTKKQGNDKKKVKGTVNGSTSNVNASNENASNLSASNVEIDGFVNDENEEKLDVHCADTNDDVQS